MTVRHMYIFKTVCECQSITAAAGKLNMTQPAVSVAIKELESFYQVKLFERMNRTIYLTEAGNTLREYADSILDKWRKAGVRTMEDVKRQDEKHGGQKTAVKEGTAPAGYRDNQPQLKPQKNKFHNFEQRNTDYDGMVLERLKQRLGES